MYIYIYRYLQSLAAQAGLLDSEPPTKQKSAASSCAAAEVEDEANGFQKLGVPYGGYGGNIGISVGLYKFWGFPKNSVYPFRGPRNKEVDLSLKLLPQIKFTCNQMTVHMCFMWGEAGACRISSVLRCCAVECCRAVASQNPWCWDPVKRLSCICNMPRIRFMWPSCVGKKRHLLVAATFTCT